MVKSRGSGENYLGSDSGSTTSYQCDLLQDNSSVAPL